MPVPLPVFILTHEITYNYDDDPCLSPIMAPRQFGLHRPQKVQCARSFRLLDDDNIVYFKGVYFGDGSGFEPLQWAYADHGCTKIQYYEKQSDGMWDWSTL